MSIPISLSVCMSVVSLNLVLMDYGNISFLQQTSASFPSSQLPKLLYSLVLSLMVPVFNPVVY